MKNLTYLFCALLILAASCKSDDDPKPRYSFKDQDLQGKIGNIAWAYLNGYADPGDDGKMDIKLTLQEGDACDIFPEGDQVFFLVPDAVGIYPLKFDIENWEAEDNQTVTLFDTEETMNYIAADGAIEILTITETEVTGRIDARVDDETFVNGNFTVTICN